MERNSTSVFSDIHSQFEKEIQYIEEKLKEISKYNPNISFNPEKKDKYQKFYSLFNTMTAPHIIISIIIGTAIGFYVNSIIDLVSWSLIVLSIFQIVLLFKKEFANRHVRWVILLLAFIILMRLPTINNFLTNNISIIASVFMVFVFVIMSIYLFVSKWYSERIVGDVVKELNVLQESLKKLKESNVQQSHAFVLSKIGELQRLIPGNPNNTQKIQSLTVLDSLRLELIQNSINGINLVEDWKYLDLSQKMIDDIMSCDNNRITMLGDLSFLSTEDGLEKLLSAIKKGKTFNIFFTGNKENEGAIKNEHCQKLVNIIRKKYYNKEKILKDINAHIILYPIISNSFTGIGFIGLNTHGYGPQDMVFDKVYAYISSHIIEETDMDITRANPFVFTWGSDKKMEHIKTYMETVRDNANQLKVIIDGQPKERTEILSIDNLKKMCRQRH